jgi:hypothetical protein
MREARRKSTSAATTRTASRETAAQASLGERKDTTSRSVIRPRS